MAINILETKDIEGSTDKLVTFDVPKAEYKEILAMARTLKKMKVIKKGDISRYAPMSDSRSKAALIAAAIGVSLNFLSAQEEHKKRLEQGLQEAADGKLNDLGSFAEYTEEEAEMEADKQIQGAVEDAASRDK